MSTVIFETLFPGAPVAIPSATSGNGFGNDTWEFQKKIQFDAAVAFNGGISGTGIDSITAASATAFQVGQTLANPAFNIDTSTGTSVNGVNIASSATGSGPTISAIGSDSAITLNIAAKSTNPVSITPRLTITGTNASTLAAGPAGITNPTFKVDASTASAATGLQVKSAAAGAGIALSAISSGTNESLTLDAKGSGIINIAGSSTGIVALARNALSALVIGQTLTTLATQNTTPTAAQLLGGVIEHASTTGAGTATLDTGTNISTAVSGVTVGDSFRCLYANTGNQTVTITTNTGLTLKGTAAIPTLKNAVLTFLNTGSNAWTVYITLSA